MTETSQASKLKIACPFCAQKLDLTGVAAFADVECPACRHSFKAPRRLDGFLLEETLGEGRVSVVYRALDAMLDRDVAVKVLRRNVSAAPNVAEKFLAEAKKLAALTHPQIVPIFTCGLDDGSAYIAMQLMRKSSLSRWLREKRDAFTPTFALSVALNVAQGLEAARQKGIIHGNVCPQNILFDEDDEPRIGDFGMASAAKNPEQSNREALSLCYSTVEYLSPELGLGGVGNERSDIYSLGAVLYHMLAGNSPFSGDNTDEAFRYRQTNPPPALPPHVKVPTPVAELVASMLAGAPNKRPAGYAPIMAVLEGQLKALKDDVEEEGIVVTPSSNSRQIPGKRKVQLPVAPMVPPNAKPGSKPPASKRALAPKAGQPQLSPRTYMPKKQKQGSSVVLVVGLLAIILTALMAAGAALRSPWYVQYVDPKVQPLVDRLMGPTPPDAMPLSPEEAAAAKNEEVVQVTEEVKTAKEPVVTSAPPPPVLSMEPERPKARPRPAIIASTPSPRMPKAAEDNETNAEVDAGNTTATAVPHPVIDVTAEPAIAPDETAAVAEPVKIDISKRPRPDDLNFAAIESSVNSYLASLDERALKREKARMNMITQLRTEWMHSRFSYDASKDGIRLKSGRTVRGAVMTNEKQMVVLSKNSRQPVKIKWEEIPTEQYIKFLANHVKIKIDHASSSFSTSAVGSVIGGEEHRRTPTEAAGEDCFRLAVLLDWYKRPADAAKYAKDAVRYNPALAEPVKGYFSDAQ